MPRIKKEDEFYTMLKEFAALIVEAADEYHKIICEFPESMSSIPQMKVYESTCDERVKSIMAKLYTSFITPIDREDISSLALAMDDVVDSMYGVAVRLERNYYSDRFADIIHENMEGSNFELLQTKYGMTDTKQMSFIIELSYTDKRESVLLGTRVHQPILKANGTLYDNKGNPIYHTEMLHLPDRCVLVV